MLRSVSPAPPHTYTHTPSYQSLLDLHCVSVCCWIAITSTLQRFEMLRTPGAERNDLDARCQSITTAFQAFMKAEVIQLELALRDFEVTEITSPFPPPPSLPDAIAAFEKLEGDIALANLPPVEQQTQLTSLVNRGQERYQGFQVIFAELRPLLESVLRRGTGLEQATSVCSRVQFLSSEDKTIEQTLSAVIVPTPLHTSDIPRILEAVAAAVSKALGVIENLISLGQGIAHAREPILAVDEPQKFEEQGDDGGEEGRNEDEYFDDENSGDSRERENHEGDSEDDDLETSVAIDIPEEESQGEASLSEGDTVIEINNKNV